MESRNRKGPEERERGKEEEQGKEGWRQKKADHSYVVSFLFLVGRSCELYGRSEEGLSGGVGMLS